MSMPSATNGKFPKIKEQVMVKGCKISLTTDLKGKECLHISLPT